MRNKSFWGLKTSFQSIVVPQIWSRCLQLNCFDYHDLTERLHKNKEAIHEHMVKEQTKQIS